MTAVPIAATDLDDDALMVRVQADDAGAFDALFERFAVRAYRVALGIAKDSTRAEDVVQDAFVSLWRGRANYRSDCGSVIAWTLGIVRNRAIDAQRREGRHDTRRAADDHFHAQVAPGKDIAETVAERDQATQLRASLACLPAAQRDVIVLAYFGELSSPEIARQLSIPLGTVKGRMRLGLQKLRFEQGLWTRPTHDDDGIQQGMPGGELKPEDASSGRVDGDVLSAISEGLVALLREFYGRGPTRTKSAVPRPFSCLWSDGGAGAAWVKPVGEIDVFTAPRVDEALRAAQAAAPRVVLDLRGVSFLDIAAFHVIVEASIRTRKSAGRFVLVRGPEEVQRALSLIGIPESIEMVELDPRHPPVQALLELARTETAA